MKLNFKQNGIIGFFIQYPRWIKVKRNPLRIEIKPYLRLEAQTSAIRENGKLTIQREFLTFRAFLMHYFYEYRSQLWKLIIPLLGFLTNQPIIAFALPIAFDAHTTGATDSATDNISFSHTNTGSNLYLTLNTSSETGGVTAITYAGSSMTEHQERTNANIGHQVKQWRLNAPASGANTVALTNTATDRVSAWADSFSGAHQSSQPDGAATNSVSTSTTVTVNVTTSFDNTIVIDCHVSNGPPATVGAGQTERVNENSGGRSGGVSTETTTTPATVTMSWSVSDSHWATAAFGAREAPAEAVVLGQLLSMKVG